MIRRIHGLPMGASVLVATVLVAVAAHAGAWFFISRHLGLSGGLASVLIAIAVAKHLGGVTGTYALLRRRRTSRTMRP